jgi:hypothetical protein
MTKIVFLDIDGVFVTHRAEKYHEDISLGYNRNIVANFLTICETHDVRVVLISTRIIHDDPWDWIEPEDEDLKKRFLDISHPDWKISTKMATSKTRYLGIYEWMARHQGEGITGYIAIDDSVSCHAPFKNKSNRSDRSYDLIPCKCSYGVCHPELILFEQLATQ